jgi:[ribosomal protein S5]-alanine N-acetyltransferase
MAARRVERKARGGWSTGVALPPAAVGAHGIPMLPDGFRTARLVLRPIAPEDAGPIFDGYAQDAEVTRFLTWRTVRSRAETEAYIARCLATPPDASRTYVLVGAEDGAVRGAFDLRRDDPYRMGFGYVLARRWWGQGLMPEALAAVAEWALAQPGVFRISALCDVENLASARAMEKAGLVREGLLRRRSVHPNIGDEPRDCFLYARVR